MDMINGLLPDWVKKIPTFMDYDGQKRAERTFQVIILLFAAVGFMWGYMCQQFSQTMYILFAGFILSGILTLPPWPMYRHKPLSWQPVRHTEESDTAAPSGAKGKKKK